VTTVLLAGAGAVGGRTARQLVDTPGLDRILIAARSTDRARELAHALGSRATAVPLDGEIPADVDAVALAIPGRAAARLAARAVAAGVPTAAATDDEEGLASLLALDERARKAGVLVVAGCALVPGLGDVLARHAADGLDEADEVHVARVGAAGPECVGALRKMRRDRPREWHDGAWLTPRRLGSQLVWFPDPIGARECEVVAPGVELLRDALPEVRHASLRAGEPPMRHASLAMFTRRQLDDGWGGARIEVWGWRGRAREAIVYGVIERPAVAAGTVLAVTAARLAGLLPHVQLRPDVSGARALGATVDPPSFLAELARRGVKAAAFDGVATV
jgi:Shikimate / quinate 5-dehydrogenase